MTYSVVFSPEALEDVLEIQRHIAKEASPAIAQRVTDAIVNHCERFREFPERAVRRDDIRPGLHITNYKVELSSRLPSTIPRCRLLACFTAAATMKRCCNRIAKAHRRQLPA